MKLDPRVIVSTIPCYRRLQTRALSVCTRWYPFGLEHLVSWTVKRERLACPGQKQCGTITHLYTFFYFSYFTGISNVN